MKVARVWSLNDIGLKNLIGAVARLHTGGPNFHSCISPYDVTLGTLVIVYQPGDMISKEACPKEALYLFEREPKGTVNYRVEKMNFEGKVSPCLFVPIEDKPFVIQHFSGLSEWLPRK